MKDKIIEAGIYLLIFAPLVLLTSFILLHFLIPKGAFLAKVFLFVVVSYSAFVIAFCITAIIAIVRHIISK